MVNSQGPVTFIPVSPDPSMMSYTSWTQLSIFNNLKEIIGLSPEEEQEQDENTGEGHFRRRELYMQRQERMEFLKE